MRHDIDSRCDKRLGSEEEKQDDNAFIEKRGEKERESTDVVVRCGV